MKTERSDELRAAVDNYMGKAHFAYLNGAANGFGAIGKILFGKNTKAYCFLVDDAKLAKAKAAERAKPGAPERLSANDVLTSAYGRACKSGLLIMACDFKGRIPGTSAEDAGQYHAALLLDESGYGEPAAIRNALSGPPPCSRAALPGCCAGLKCKTGLITSWAVFKDIAIPECTPSASAE